MTFTANDLTAEEIAVLRDRYHVACAEVEVIRARLHRTRPADQGDVVDEMIAASKIRDGLFQQLDAVNAFQPNYVREPVTRPLH